ncbi:MAG TPA: hypothetical protein VGF25_02795 [Thermoleophilaceae bacterium]|jgi:hypothetical protein
MSLKKLRSELGFTTVTLMGVLLVGGLLVIATFAAVDPDISLSRSDQDYKQSHGAAEAGLQWYLNRLGQDNNFYVRCTNVPKPNATENAPVNQAWNGTGADPRKWRKISGEQAEYSVELLPAPGFSTCQENNQYSMVDSNGNLRVRVTGRSRGKLRTVLATLRRKNFLDFIYFTHFETSDPATYGTAADVATATSQCAKFRSQRTSFCQEIQFAPTDIVRGPFHTNDNIRVCESPTFGRNSRDLIEISGTPAEVASSGCGSSPNYLGTKVNPADQLGMPPSNTTLSTVATPSYRFQGRTEIVLNGASMTVTNAQINSGVPTSMSLPANGVIYVGNTAAGCSVGYIRSQTYTSTPTSCGDVWVKGTYGRDLTIAAGNDVVVEGDLARANDGLLLGLIANNFVRVYHPVTFTSSGSDVVNGCRNNPVTPPVVSRIDAAILALQHSFIVDNWNCGEPLGDLNIFGAIAQRFRGPVGTGNSSSIVTGYRKEYVYNDRLRYREPPYFLDPVQAAWRIARETEQVPAVGVR